MSGCETYIGMCDRDSAVSSIRVMQRFYNFGADTFASAVAYMDMFLSKVKVKRRYLSCISAACFYLSAKMNEESEVGTSIFFQCTCVSCMYSQVIVVAVDDSKIQSTLLILKSKGPSETLRDIHTSTYQIRRIEENTKRTTEFHK